MPDPPASNKVRQFRFGAFELDVKLGTLCRDGERLSLPGQAMQILEILVSSPKQLVTRAQLRQALWPDGTFVAFDDVLNQNIRRLRQALEDDAEEPRFIETLPRRGYRFIAAVEDDVPPSNQQVEMPRLAKAETWGMPLRLRLALLGTAVVVVGVWALWKTAPRTPNAPKVLRSIAVLPLENLSGDPSQEYFADGMTDALITSLAKLNSIRVISRTSIMQYKGARKSLPQIARELNVDAVVEGTVVRSGQNVRITAQLIQAATDRHLWAESYQQNSEDVLRLQSQVALAIAEQVQGRLDPPERNRFNAARVDPDAYEAYVKGRYFWSKFTLDSVNKSRDFFIQAIQKDPSYASAYVGLAESQINLMFAYNAISPANGCGEAESAAKKAVDIDDSIAEAHAALARFKFQCNWEWAAAGQEFQQAIALEPGSSEVHHQYAHYLMAMGRITDAWDETSRALELDPYGIRTNSHLGWHHFYARQPDVAIRDFQRTLSMEPSDGYSRRYLANCYEQKRMYAEALAELMKTPPGPAWTPVLRAALGYAHAMAGHRRDAMVIANELESKAKRQYVSAFDIGLIYVGLGESKRAIDWLEKAYRERSPLLIYLKVDPRFDDLRTDPQFQDLARRVGL